MQRNHRGVIASYKASFMPPTNRRATLCGRGCATVRKAHDRDLDIPGDEYYNPVLNTSRMPKGQKTLENQRFLPFNQFIKMLYVGGS